MSSSSNNSLSSSESNEEIHEESHSKESLTNDVFYMAMRSNERKDIRDYTSYNVLQSYCIPCEQSHLQHCRYGSRDCLFSKLKITNQGLVDNDKNTTYYIPKKNRYGINKIDITPMKCFNDDCKMGLEDNTLNFIHFCCYAYWVEKNNSNADHLFMKSLNIETIRSKLKVTNEDADYLKGEENLLLPFCKKRCLKAINNSIEQIEQGDKDNDKDGNIYWDSDGKNGKRSSEKIIVDWLCTEENCKLYFGGKNSAGKTNANRKDTYHN